MSEKRILIDADKLMKCIEEQTIVEVEPVRYGKWIEKPYLIGTSNYCSVCGENFGRKYKRCPNCAAKMEE